MRQRLTHFAICGVSASAPMLSYFRIRCASVLGACLQLIRVRKPWSRVTMFSDGKQRYRLGFTIIELLIATSVFGFIMLVVATGVLRFTHDYYKGITSSKTQSTTRSIMLSVAQSIEFGKTVQYTAPTLATGWVGDLCVDNTLYLFKLGQQVTDTAPSGASHQGYHALLQQPVGTCPAGLPAFPAIPFPANSRELLNQHMRLSAFEVTTSPGSLYTVRVRIIYGDDDLLNPTLPPSPNWAIEGCKSTSGSQFCAVSDLNTTVEKRLL